MPLFMIVEHFRNGEAAPVYRRFKERGRMAPDGLTYVSSWVDENLATCYQLMETANRALLDHQSSTSRSVDAKLDRLG